MLYNLFNPSVFQGGYYRKSQYDCHKYNTPKDIDNKLNSEGFLDGVAKKGEYFRKKLAEIPEVEAVSGIGLMIGIRLRSKKAADIVKLGLENGLLLLTAKDKLRLLPPLTITYEEIDKGMEILSRLLK